MENHFQPVTYNAVDLWPLLAWVFIIRTRLALMASTVAVPLNLLMIVLGFNVGWHTFFAMVSMLMIPVHLAALRLFRSWQQRP